MSISKNASVESVVLNLVWASVGVGHYRNIADACFGTGSKRALGEAIGCFISAGW